MNQIRSTLLSLLLCLSVLGEARSETPFYLDIATKKTFNQIPWALPTDDKTHQEIENVFHQNQFTQNDPQSILKSLNQSVFPHPKFTQLPQYSQAYYYQLRAEISAKANQPEQAISDLNRAIGIGPIDPSSAYLLRGKLYLDNKELMKAIDNFKLAYHSQKYNSVFASPESAKEIADFTYLPLIANTYFGAGAYDSAIEIWTYLISQTEYPAEYFEKRAVAYALLNNKEFAIRDYQKAIDEYKVQLIKDAGLQYLNLPNAIQNRIKHSESMLKALK